MQTVKGSREGKGESRATGALGSDVGSAADSLCGLVRETVSAPIPCKGG